MTVLIIIVKMLVKPPSYPLRKFTTAYLHELLTKPISESSLSKKNELYVAKYEPYSESTWLVTSTSPNITSPGDILKLMSILDKGKDTSNKKQIAFSNEVNMNGKTYRECGQHVIFYVTKSSRSSMHSLIDRGANGRVAGSDVRVIETYPDRKVDIRGIDNYQISSIPLVTAGGVTTTTTGELIVFMHQHASKNKTIHFSPQIDHYKNIVDDCSIKVGC